MIRWWMVAVAGAMMSIASAAASTGALAFEFQITNPVLVNNLSVYFVESPDPGGSSILSLDRAMAQGAVKIYQQQPSSRIDPTTHQRVYVNGPVAIENLSAQSVFIQLGDLLRGGLQDQVVARSFILAPRSGRVSIDTLCVDPFRSTARVGDSASFFSTPAVLFPWRLAKLDALTALSTPTVQQTNVRRVRQLGIWWSMDSLRDRLGQRLGVPLEPAVAPSWEDGPDPQVDAELAARLSHWRTGLPLSLENPELGRAVTPYLNALDTKGIGNSRIVGAMFVINGQIDGADIYGSHALFAEMWPKLLRAYATEAVAFAATKNSHLPTIPRLREILAAAEQAPARDVGAGNSVRETASGIFATTAAADGAWVYRSYVAKHPADKMTPEGAIINVLESGTAGGREIAGIEYYEMLVLHRHGTNRPLTGSVEGHPNNDNINVTSTFSSYASVTAAGNSELSAQERAAIDRVELLTAQRRSVGGSSHWLIGVALVFSAMAAVFVGRRVRRKIVARQLPARAVGEPKQAPRFAIAAPAPLAAADPVSLGDVREWRAPRAADRRRRIAAPEEPGLIKKAA